MEGCSSEGKCRGGIKENKALGVAAEGEVWEGRLPSEADQVGETGNWGLGGDRVRSVSVGEDRVK